MDILIIGGTRFLGYHLTKRLLEDGHQLTLFNRGKTPDDFGDQVIRIRGDRTNPDIFKKSLQGKSFDVVIDMIAYKSEDSRVAVQTFSGNIGHFIHISTAAVYIVTKNYPCPLREEDYDRPLTEPSQSNPGLWEYGFHKRRCEEVLQTAFKEDSFPATIIRPPIIIGERDYTLRAYSYFVRLRDRKPLILPDSGMNVFTHVYQDDLVRPLSANLKNKNSFGRAYNLAQPSGVTLKEFLQTAARIMEKKPDFVSIPTDILEDLGWDRATSPFSNRRPFILDIRKAQKELNYRPSYMETWLKKTIHWFEEEYTGEPPANYAHREHEIKIVKAYRNAVQSIAGS
ncbi:MAG: NAD-dependent epimerase/dehydratase family protein [Acidobacteriota bacterium]